MYTLNHLNCSLCHNTIIDPYEDSEERTEVFCCRGCQVVYEILKMQGALDQFKNHPVYKQAIQAGLITNPNFSIDKEEEGKIPQEDFLKLHLTIQNMWCPSCAQVIHLILLKEKGVRVCAVDYSTDIACIEYTPRLISKERIICLIEQLGYLTLSLQDPRQHKMSRHLLLRFIVAAFCSLNIMMFSYPIYAAYLDGGDALGYANFFAWLSLLSALPVLIYSAWPIWRRLYTGLQVNIWGMEVLVFIGVTTATGLSFYELYVGSSNVYFDSITAIITFVLLGKLIETRAKFSATDALLKLSSALPRRGRKKFPTGEVRFVPIKEIEPGDLIIVRMGEKIVVDGIIEEGEGACDESLLTGEATLVPKKKGVNVLAGTLVQKGSMTIRVISALEESVLQQIINMVGEEIEHKSRYVRSADIIVKWFVPGVFLLSLSVAIFCIVWEVSDHAQTVAQTAMIRAISVLLISCPCAIGIAAPLAESYLLNVLAKWGVIVRNRGCLPFLGRETVFVFDKTGTLTEGKFAVYNGLEALSFEDKRVLKGITSDSLHPIAIAIQQALLCPPVCIEACEEILGNGIQGGYEGVMYYLGSESFLAQKGIHLPKIESTDESAILTTVYFANEVHFLSVLLLGDRLKKGVEDFIHLLSPVKTILLSGDSSSPVAKVAKACDIQEWHAGCRPWEKKKMIDRLKKEGKIVAMLGDGINDAPALTAAHVGIAVVSATDISIQVSDLLMTTSSFQVLSLMRKVAIKGQKIIKQNLFWAFFYNCVGLGLAAAGMLTPLFAAFAMVISSLMVLFNARRITSFSKGNISSKFT